MNKLVSAVDKYSWINNDVHTRKAPSIGTSKWDNGTAEIKDIIVIWFRMSAFWGENLWLLFFGDENLLHNCFALLALPYNWKMQLMRLKLC